MKILREYIAIASLFRKRCSRSYIRNHSAACFVRFTRYSTLSTRVSAVPCGDLMWYCNVGKVRIDNLYNLVIVIADALKLEIKVVKSGDELLAEDSFNNKTTSVVLQSGFAEQLAKADVLLLVKPERIFITWRSGSCLSGFGSYPYMA